MSPMIQEWLLYFKQHAALYWNLPLILANKEIYIGVVFGTLILFRMMQGPLKLAALALGFWGPSIYWTYFHTVTP